MPIYCYRTADNVSCERFFRLGKAPKWVRIGGKVARRSLVDETKVVSVVGGESVRGRGWPMTCVASGVNANQAGELREFLAKKGVPTEVTPDGDPVYRNAAHRKKALKARGLHDKSSFD